MVDKKKQTKSDIQLERLISISERIDSLHKRLDTTNDRVAKLKDDLGKKIDIVRQEQTNFNTNHLEQHRKFRNSVIKIVKWGLSTSGGAGAVLAILKVIGVI